MLLRDFIQKFHYASELSWNGTEKGQKAMLWSVIGSARGSGNLRTETVLL